MSFNEKQLHIIDTAEKLFANRGYDGTSVRDIADEADVNIAMISYYFGSKDKLMQAIFEHRTNFIIGKVEELLHNQTLEPIEKVNMLVDDYVERLMYKQDFYRLMVSEQVLKKDSIVASLLHEQKKRNTQLIEQLIREGQKKGVFRPDVDTVLLMNTLVGVGIHSFINKDYYRFYNQEEQLTEEEFLASFRLRLSNHIKTIFKALLSHEA